MTEYISEADQEKLAPLFDGGAARVPSEPEHWIHNADEGESYCYECCKKEVKRLLKENPDGEYCVDGGWGTDGDSTRFCEKCEKLLENSLTDYGCEAELEHFLEFGFDPKCDDDCRAMSEVISSRGWRPIKYDFMKQREDEAELEYFADLHKLCKWILEKIGATP